MHVTLFLKPLNSTSRKNHLKYFGPRHCPTCPLNHLHCHVSKTALLCSYTVEGMLGSRESILTAIHIISHKPFKRLSLKQPSKHIGIYIITCIYTHEPAKRKTTNLRRSWGFAIDDFEPREWNQGGSIGGGFGEELLLPIPHGLLHSLVGLGKRVILGLHGFDVPLLAHRSHAKSREGPQQKYVYHRVIVRRFRHRAHHPVRKLHFVPTCRQVSSLPCLLCFAGFEEEQ